MYLTRPVQPVDALFVGVVSCTHRRNYIIFLPPPPLFPLNFSSRPIIVLLFYHIELSICRSYVREKQALLLHYLSWSVPDETLLRLGNTNPTQNRW